MLTVTSLRRRNEGFTLVELMVALVLGLIVVGAVLALVLSIMKSNRQTIQATRLTQELRATAAVIANDLRRARGVEDPFSEAKLASGNRFKNIDYSTPGCIRYAYAGAIGGSCHAIVRATTGADANRVFLATAAPVSGLCDTVTTCPTAGTGTKLGSDQVRITALTFTPTAPASPTAETARSFNLTITGELITGDSELAAVTRTISQLVYVRSIGAGNP